jgi:8-oxo-dGTP pyrophosphatase MutT (NUDIX family)
MSVEPKPSGTVVVIRDGHEHLEVLLLERSRSRGTWVFPGGKVEESDRSAQTGDAQERARHAAVREALEEAGLILSAPALLPISRWITPEIARKRFDTWFFVARAQPDTEVRVDGAEICDHRWLAPQRVLEAQRRRQMRLAPPTFVTVSWLVGHETVADAIEALGRQELLTFRPRVCSSADGGCVLYPGDAGYEEGDVERPGPRHRLWVLPEGWRYERGAS